MAWPSKVSNNVSVRKQALTIFIGNKHQMPTNLLAAQAAATSAKPKRAPKVSLKAMITEASKTIANSTNSDATKSSHGKAPNRVSQYLKWVHAVTSAMLLLTQSTLSFVNLLVADYESIRKKTPSGTIKGWAAVVHEQTYPEAQGSVNSSATPNPPVSGTLSTSQATKVNTLTATTTTQCSGTDAGITTKFGGFDLDSDLEQETAPFKNKEGKSNDNIALVRICVLDTGL